MEFLETFRPNEWETILHILDLDFWLKVEEEKLDEVQHFLKKKLGKGYRILKWHIIPGVPKVRVVVTKGESHG